METGNNTNHVFRLAALIVVTLIAYSPILCNEFAWDDLDIIVRDPFVKSFSNAPRFFQPSHWQRYYPGDYRPLRSLLLAATYRCWGSNPFGFHFANLLIHVLNATAVYILLYAYSGKGATSLTGALLFSLYPLHSESVAWAKNVAELLAAFFSLLALLLFLAAGRPTGNRRRAGKALLVIGSLLCFVLALLSKGSAVILPLILVIMTCRPPRREAREPEWGSLSAFWAIAGAFVLFQIFLPEGNDLGTPPPLPGGLGERGVVILHTCSRYLLLLLFPFQNSAERLLPLPVPWTRPSALAGYFLFFAYAAFAARQLRGRSLLAPFLAWPLAALLPAANIIFLSSRPLAEQRLYFPAIGVCCGAAIAIDRLRAGPRNGGGQRGETARRLSLATLLLFCALLTVIRNREWKDEITLFTEIRPSGASPRVRLNLANAYLRAGRLDEAFNECAELLKLDPGLAEARATMSNVYEERGMLEKACEEMERARKLNPRHPGILNNLGLLRVRRGDWKGAEAAFREALRLDPENLQVLNNLANCRRQSGDLEAARDLWKQILKIDPGNESARMNLGVLPSPPPPKKEITP